MSRRQSEHGDLPCVPSSQGHQHGGTTLGNFASVNSHRRMREAANDNSAGASLPMEKLKCQCCDYRWKIVRLPSTPGTGATRFQ